MKKSSKVSKKIPIHVGIIMDGNRRWAQKRGLPSFEGHRRGFDQAKKITEHAFGTGVKYLTLFAFSTENWHRTKAEVSYLMNLFIRFFDEHSKALHKKGIRIRILGVRGGLSKAVLQAIDRSERLTERNTNGTLAIAFNYGGRREILEALDVAIAKKTRTPLTEEQFSTMLWTAGMPDPDLIIRTSGEHRLSGFLLWQAAYAELYFTDTLWPSFTTKQFGAALAEYARRQRRFGT